MAADYLVMLLLGLAVAISPIPLLALALVLLSPRRRADGLAFLVGWMSALTAVCLLARFLTDAVEAVLGAESPTWTSFVKLGVGVIFILMGLRSRQAGLHRESASQLPAFASHVEHITPARSLGLAAFLGSVGVKNPLICLTAASFMVSSGLGAAARILGWVLFIAAGSLSIAIPVFYTVLGGEGAVEKLERWHDWVEAHGHDLMAATFWFMGIMFAASALADIVSTA